MNDDDKQDFRMIIYGRILLYKKFHYHEHNDITSYIYYINESI